MLYLSDSYAIFMSINKLYVKQKLSIILINATMIYFVQFMSSFISVIEVKLQKSGHFLSFV